jgi:DNA-binding transcriptional regulator YhcF (GntR family)
VRWPRTRRSRPLPSCPRTVVTRRRRTRANTLPAIRICLDTVSYGCCVTQRLDRFASHRLAEALRTKIISGTCPPGSQIPSYRQLRDAHGVALNTAQAAIRILAAEGLTEIRPARNAYVRGNTCDGDSRTMHAELIGLRAALRWSKDDLDAAENRIAVLLSQLRSEDGVR